MAPLPAFKSYISHLFLRSAQPSADSSSPSSPPSSIFQAINQLLPRDSPTPTATINPGQGATDPQDVNMKFIFILFGVIGASFVCTGIWFFFWARDGGFYYKQGDWEEYKSTVLRRKGPNGTTLSGATTATDLGGGSVVHGQKEKTGRSIWGGRRKEKTHTAGKSKKSGRKGKGKQQKYKDLEYDEESVLGTEEMSEVQHHGRKPSRLRGGDLGNAGSHDESNNVHASVQEAMRAYRHEKPARVGGLNKESEASTWDGTTNPTGSDISGTGSEAGLLKNKQSTPTNSPKKDKKDRKDNYTGGSGSPSKVKGGIRKVVSSSTNDTPTKAGSNFWSRNNKSSPATKRPEPEKIKSEARKLQEKGRSVGSPGHRDFSFQSGAPDDSTVVSDESARRERMRERAERRQRGADGIRVPGSWDGSVMGSEVSEESGTKVYDCHIPGLSSGNGLGNGGYSDEKRKARGFRRDI